MLHVLIAACCLIGGNVHTDGGAPIVNAHVVLKGPVRREKTTDAKGDFSIEAPPGRYELTAAATGFVPVVVDLDEVARDTRVDVSLDLMGSPKLRTIGEVSVNGGYALVRNAVPEVNVSRADMDALGYTNITQALAEVPSVVISRPDAGSPTAPAVVSLRGPDPSEALVTLDGQLLNDANTGDVDLSQFPVAAFSSVNVTEGLGPSDSLGSNTFGGAVNLVMLQPTQQPHFSLSASQGSYDTSQLWLNYTGTSGKFGYALAGSNFQQRGMTNEAALVYPQNNAPIDCGSSDPQNCPSLTQLGSTISSRGALANLVYNFSQRANLGVRFFNLGNFRDESSALNGIAGNQFEPCHTGNRHCADDGFTDRLNPEFGLHVGSGNAIYAQNVRFYDVHSQSVLGAGSLLAEYSASDNGVSLSGGTGAISPYDVSHQDKRYNEAISWGRTFDTAEYSVGGYARQESLTGVGITQTLDASINAFYLRGAEQFTPRLRVAAGLYQARYSTFGSSLDWRAQASYDVGTSSVVRASAGTGFRPPLLVEQYWFAPVVTSSGNVAPNPGLPPPDQNCVVGGQGNPNERSEHATSYELGYSGLFSPQSSVDVSLYRSNLRDTIENYYPLGNFCGKGSPNGFVYSYPINIGNAVYEGAEIRFKQRFPRQHLTVDLDYGLNVAYPYSLGSNVSNPTSGGTLVDYQQFLGVPQQQGSTTLTWAENGWHAATNATFAGGNNTLNQAPYALFNAAAGKTIGHLDFTVSATNLFNAVSGPYTSYLTGTPYRSLLGSNHAPYVVDYPTDRLFIQPAAVNFVLTYHE